MRRIMVAVVVIVALRGVSFAKGDQSPRFNASFDYFAVGNFNEPFETDTSNATHALADLGYNSSGKTTTNAGIGGRIGVAFPVGNGFSIGGSAGYVGGLNAKQTVTGTSGASNVSIISETKVHFLRFLVEGAKKIPVSEGWGVNLGAGLGVANGKADINSTATGAISLSDNKSKSWTGFTWEVSPALYWNLDRTELQVGLRYAQFPTLSESNDNVKIQWNTLGAFVGLSF